MERGVVQGLAAFRWAAWLWMCATLVVARRQLLRPWLAVTLVGVALAITAVAGARRSLPRGLVAAELAAGAALVLGDGWAFGAHHAFGTAQALGSVWPLAGILGAGVALGPWAGAGAGVVMGTARIGGTFANGVRTFDAGRILSLTNTAVFYVVAGAIAGYLVALLRRAEAQVSTARAREELARTLHDGVLQTLAVVERRAGDPALARLARDQERELRHYLFGTADQPLAVRDLGTALRSAAARFEQAYGGRVEVLIPDDVPILDGPRIDAVAGAVGEALTNAGKHGDAQRVTVFVEPDGNGLFCSVKDDGRGFEPAGAQPRVGLSRSIRGRMEEIGGRAEIVSKPGSGAEVRLWVP